MQYEVDIYIVCDFIKLAKNAAAALLLYTFGKNKRKGVSGIKVCLIAK